MSGMFTICHRDSSINAQSIALREQNEFLTNQLGQINELAQGGQSPVLALLTQEPSNARFQQYENQIRALEGEIDKRKAIIAEKDALLTSREEECK